MFFISESRLKALIREVVSEEIAKRSFTKPTHPNDRRFDRLQCDELLAIVRDLETTDDSYKVIGDRYKVSRSIVHHIAVGKHETANKLRGSDKPIRHTQQKAKHSDTQLQAIIVLLKEGNLSLNQIAQKIGVHYMTVYNIKSGAHRRAKELQKQNNIDA